MDKKTLRKQISEKKRAMTPCEIAQKSEELTKLFLQTEQYRQASVLYGYLSYNQEVRTEGILRQAMQDGKTVAVPKVYGEEMKFIVLTDFDGLKKSDLGIPEPICDAPVAQDPQALVLMPGVAFTERGDRMGYGGGFYDKFLAQEPQHPTVALCYDFQLVDALPTEEFDIPVDLVLWA